MVCTGRGTGKGVDRWDGQCKMDIIRLNGKVWGYYWQSIDIIARSYKVMDIIGNNTKTLLKWQRGQDRIGKSRTLL